MLGIAVAAVVSLAFAVALAPVLIDYFRARGVGALANPDRPATHLAKAGTPDMGGIVILVAATIGYLAAHIRPTHAGIDFHTLTAPGVLVIAVAWGQGIVGAVDDLLKFTRRNPRGLSKRKKMIGSLVVGSGFCYGAVQWAGLDPRVSFTGTSIGPTVPLIVFGAWILFVVAGATHGVNMADGLDGLAGGNAAMIFFVFTIVGFWEFRNPAVYGPLAGSATAHLDIAIASAALFGACIGFLWWNAPPARVTMGDTGALALGGAIAALALFTRTQLLLPILGGVFVVETATSWLQTQTINRYGRRIFRKAPIHHHFEELGWPEATVLVRFWLVAGALSGLGLAIFYSQFLASAGP